MNTLTKTPTVEFMLERNILPEALVKIIGDIMIPSGLNIGFIGGFNSGPKYALRASARRGLKEDAPILTNIDLDYEEFKQAAAFSETDIFKLDEELKPHHNLKTNNSNPGIPIRANPIS